MEKLPWGARVLLFLLKRFYGIDPLVPAFQVRAASKQRYFLTRAEKVALAKAKENEKV